MVDVTLNNFVLLKKVIEIALECTEVVRLTFWPSTQLTLELVDALWVCQQHFLFDATFFHHFHLGPNPVTYFLDLKMLHDWIRRCKGLQHIRIFEDAENLNIQEVGDTTQALKMKKDHLTPYLDFAQLNFTEWVHLTLPAAEFCNMILDMTVGGTETTFTLTPENLLIQSTFDVGSMEFTWPLHHLPAVPHLPATPHLPAVPHLPATPHQPAVPMTFGPFIIKYLKSLCSSCLLCDVFELYLQPHQLIITFQSPSLLHTFFIKTYTGPLGQHVAAPYRNFTLREN